MFYKKLTGALKYIVLAAVIFLAACQNAGAEGAIDTETQDGPFTLLQLEPLTPGEELAVLHTSLGDIKLRFFPEDAPKAVENFITHAKDGYYDGLLFHRVLNEFMIQGGDPLGTGTGGESIWGGGFENEFSFRLRHFRGALAMAHSDLPDSNGSQFYIVQNTQLNPDSAGYYEELRGMQDELAGETADGVQVYYRDIMPLELIDNYINNGGTPHLDFFHNENGHTVFGHVVEGMDIVDAIAAVPVNEDQSSPEYGRPLEDVVINNITFETAP